MDFVTLHCHGNQVTIAKSRYDAKYTEAYGKWLENGFDNFEWHGYGLYDFEAELFEDIMQAAIDEAEAMC